MQSMQWIRNHMFAQPPVVRFKSMVINKDNVIYEWHPIKQYQLSFVNQRVPHINEYRIDYKRSDDGIKWNHTICTGSSDIHRIIFYKMKIDANGQYITIPPSYNENGTRHEYGVFRNDLDQYDIRIYGINYADPIYNYHTHTKLALYNPEVIEKIHAVCSTKPTSDFDNKYYIISSHHAVEDWEHMNNYITTSFMSGWIFFKPDEHTLVDGYRYRDGEWIDEKLMDTIRMLIDNNQYNDTIFEILKYDFISRVLGDSYSEKSITLKNILKEYRY